MPDTHDITKFDRLRHISRRVDQLVGGSIDDSGETRIAHFGRVACVQDLRLRLVPFFEPCVIFVMAGTKTLGEETVHEGGCLAVPAPTNFHMGNAPNAELGMYQAMVFPFDDEDMEHVRAALGYDVRGRGNSRDIVTYDYDDDTLNALEHYLKSSTFDSPVRVAHRKREILLILAERDPRICDLAQGCADWTQKLRMLFSQAPANSWSVAEVCRDLAVSESTLRRNLNSEGTSFREVLSEFRLGNALMQILMTNDPLYHVAYDNGFQSVSRFSENFRKRYGQTPSSVRARLTDNG